MDSSSGGPGVGRGLKVFGGAEAIHSEEDGAALTLTPRDL